MSARSNRRSRFFLKQQDRIFFLCAFLFISSGCSNKPVPKYKNTNVIVISIDTLRYDHLGCYGYAKKTSPNIDRLAGESVVFENFISQAYLTPVSQWSIFISQDPRANGLIRLSVPVAAKNVRTLADILKYYDYTNAAFLSSPEFYKAVFSREKNIFARSFDVFSPVEPRGMPAEALKWVAQNKDKKMFLWVSLGNVHWPYAKSVPDATRDTFGPSNYQPFFLKLGDSFGEFNGFMPRALLHRIYKDNFYIDFAPVYSLTQQDKDYIVSRYDAGIFYADLFIGELLDVLRKNGLMDNTILVLHSVHGEDLGEHGYFSHYDVYDTEVKNALMIKLPSGMAKARRIRSQVRGLDIMPTVLDCLDIPVPHDAEGQSLLPLIKYGHSRSLGPFAFGTRIPLWETTLVRESAPPGLWEHDWYEATFTANEKEEIAKYKESLRANLSDYEEHPVYDIFVRTNDWKLILRKSGPLLKKISYWKFISGQEVPAAELELYDLNRDPLEQNNCADAYPGVVNFLKERLLAWDSAVEKRRGKQAKETRYEIIPYP